jgi:hypothetical protein
VDRWSANTATSAGCLGRLPPKTLRPKSFRKQPALLADLAAGDRHREEFLSNLGDRRHHLTPAHAPERPASQNRVIHPGHCSINAWSSRRLMALGCSSENIYISGDRRYDRKFHASRTHRIRTVAMLPLLMTSVRRGGWRWCGKVYRWRFLPHTHLT